MQREGLFEHFDYNMEQFEVLTSTTYNIPRCPEQPEAYNFTNM